MTKNEAVREAAREILAHGGPNCSTDPHIGLRAMARAIDLGATEQEIQAAMCRQRETA
ncbi:hypothetical protein ACPC54_23585 [Kitasatospora sp. NPDC094028]